MGDTFKGEGEDPWRVTRMSMDREQRTIRAMVEIYCHAHHAEKKELCEHCQDLYEYAQARLGKCPFGPDKPVCAKCPIHCYHPERREQIREVMRFSGPRMALKHPGLAVAHLLQSKKPVPPRRGKSAQDGDAKGTGPECHGCNDT